MRRLPPLLEEFVVAAGLMTGLAIIVAVGFHLITGLSPWPYVILAEIVGFGWGTVLLALTSPRGFR